MPVHMQSARLHFMLSFAFALAALFPLVAGQYYDASAPPLAFPANATVPMAYPLFKQCDPTWGNDTIVDKTVCQVGCLMSSCAMALDGHGITLPDGSGIDPGTRARAKGR